MEIKTFEAHHVDSEKIILKGEADLKTLFNDIEEDKNFIIKWKENKEEKTKLFIGDGLLAQLKDGRLMLEAKKEVTGEEEVSDEGDRDQ